MVDHGSAMFIPQRRINLNVCTSGIWPWLTIRSFDFWMWNWPWLTMVAWYNLTMVNHGSTMVKTLPDHGQPWLTMVRPCSSSRGVLIWMSAHQVFYHDWPWSFDFWMWNWPWLTMVRPWLPDITWPWSKHCQTMVNHGWPWFGHVHPLKVCWFECQHIRYLTMIDHGHLIFECGTDHGCLI